MISRSHRSGEVAGSSGSSPAVGESRRPGSSPFPGAFSRAGMQPEEGSGLVLAACRSSWRAPLAREVACLLGLELHCVDRPDGLERAVDELVAEDAGVALAILESSWGGEDALLWLTDALPDTPVIVVGEGDDIGSRLSAAVGGAAAFVPQPVSLREVVRVGRRILLGSCADARRAGIPLPPQLL